MAMACAMEHEMDEKSEARILGFVDYLVRARRDGREWIQDLLSVMGDDRKLPRPLSMIPKGEKGVVSRVTADGPLRMRLFEMGFVPGTMVVRTGEAPLGDPLTVDVRGGEVALRRIEAASVWICASPE